MTLSELLILLSLSVLIYKAGSMIVTEHGISIKYSGFHLVSKQQILGVIINKHSSVENGKPDMLTAFFSADTWLTVLQII